MTSTTRRRFLHLAGAALATPFVARGSLAAASSADGWPSRPLRVMVPFSAGSTTDLVGRVVMEQLSEQFKQPVVVENRGGAGGTIGSAIVAQAAPDGYSLLVHSSAHSAVPAAHPKAPYDAINDFVGVASFGVVPNIIVISPQKNIKSLAELVDAAKSGRMTFASAGIGSATHWAAERFRLSAGFEATHIPFRGGPEAMTEVITGRVDFYCAGVGSSLPFIRDGRALAIGVCTKERSSALPDVPTTTEAGYADSDYSFWNGLLAPAKTPRPIIEKLHAAVTTALATTTVQERFAPQGFEPMPVTPEEFDEVIKTEMANSLEIVKAANLVFN